jgi:hypothetical protein
VAFEQVGADGPHAELLRVRAAVDEAGLRVMETSFVLGRDASAMDADS